MNCLRSHIRIRQRSKKTYKEQKNGKLGSRPPKIKAEPGDALSYRERVRIRVPGDPHFPQGPLQSWEQENPHRIPRLLDWYEEPLGVFAEISLKSMGSTAGLILLSHPVPAAITLIEATVTSPGQKDSALASSTAASPLPELCGWPELCVPPGKI